ncbi:MAG: DnaJ domain-containing protein [Planctomycetes bacterium]|nr:DnaJ domain-containing protein [Planctomycetota bacterium]
MAEDFYKVLGVARGASKDEIRKVYRKLSRENHPDAKPDDKAAAERFQQVQDAWDVLGDDEKRAKYDQFGHAAFDRSGGPFQQSGPIDMADLFGGGGFDFGDLFGGGRRAKRPQKGQDITASIEVSFTTAAEGGNHELTLNTSAGLKRLDVRIPAGISSGQAVRLKGQGHAGMHGGPPGDVRVTVKIAPHPWFRREGNNLLVDVPITMTEAALGAKVDVPTLTEGLISLTIPPGSSSGAKLRVRGKGCPDRGSGQRGDQIVVLKIVVPKELDELSRKLLEEFAERAVGNPRDGLW